MRSVTAITFFDFLYREEIPLNPKMTYKIILDTYRGTEEDLLVGTPGAFRVELISLFNIEPGMWIIQEAPLYFTALGAGLTRKCCTQRTLSPGDEQLLHWAASGSLVPTSAMWGDRKSDCIVPLRTEMVKPPKILCPKSHDEPRLRTMD